MKKTGILLILVMILSSVFTLFSCNKDTTYTVTFVVDGEVYYTTELLEGVTVTMPDEPTKEGFVFTGWRVETGFAYNESEGVSGNVTFVAEWREDSHTHLYTDDCDKVCDIADCGYERIAPHKWTNNCDAVCDCGETRSVPDHKYTDECDKTCNEAGCNYERVAPHKWASACDDECDCGQTRSVPDHVYDNDCDKICNECLFERTVSAHTYTDNCDKTCNETGCNYERVAPHKWTSACDSECDCGETRSVPDHKYTDDCDKTCNVAGCNYERIAPHKWTSACDDECDCGETRSVPDHKYTDNCDKTCNEAGCNYERIAPHKWASACDDECDCGETRSVPDHVYTDDCDKTCNVAGCGYERIAPHKWASACDDECDCGEARSVPDHVDEVSPIGKCDVCGADVESNEIDDSEVFEGMQSVLLIGQSNMAGRGSLNRVDPIESDKIFMWRNGGWVKMQEPIHQDKTSAGVGLAASFAKGFVDTFGNDIGLIPGAYGGSSLEDWAVGGKLYNDALAMAREAQKSSSICAILWHQGESDTGNNNYADEFKAIIDAFISDLGLDESKIVIITGELGEWRGTSVNKVHNALYSLDDYYTNYGVASAEGLINRPVYEQADDTGHFDAPSQRVLGYRYFNIFYQLVTGKSYVYDDDHNSYRKDVAPTPEPEPVPSDYLVYKTFDDLNTGVTSSINGLALGVRGAGFKVYLKSEGGTDKYLSVEFGDGSQTVFPYFDASISVDSESVIVIEGTFRLSSDFEAAGELFKLTGTDGGASTNLRLVWIDSDGKLYNMTGNTNSKGTYLGIHLDQFEWTTVKVVCNLKANTKEIYCNGQKLATTYAISDSATSSFAVSKVRVMQVNTTKSPSNEGALHVDNFKIYEQTEASYIMNESFDGLSLGIAGTVGGISAPSGRGELNICGKGDSTSDKYLSFELSGASSTPYADIASTVQQGSVAVIETKIKLGEDFSATGELFKFIDASSTSVRLVWIDSDGKLYNMCDTKAKGDDLGIQLKADEWLTLKIVCDFENNTKSVYLEGELVAEELPLSASSVSEYEIARLRLMHCSSSSYAGAICFDDFKYYVE